ncbi:hypothetical protein [Robertmurraya sp. Marseille-Q9965]
MAEEISFTQEQLDEAIQNAKNDWIEKEYNPIKVELEDVKGKLPKDLTEEEKALQTKQQELWQKEVSLSLKENGLEAFASIIKVTGEDDLKEVVKSLTQIVNDIKVSAGYVPNDHSKDNEYDVFAKNGDTKGMIASKLGKLFG